MPQKSKSRSKGKAKPSTIQSSSPSSYFANALDFYDLFKNLATFGPPNIRILPSISASKQDGVTISFNETPEKIVEIPCPNSVAVNAKDTIMLLRGQFQSVIDGATEEERYAVMENTARMLHEVMQGAVVRNSPGTITTSQDGGSTPAKAATESEDDVVDYATAVRFQNFVASFSISPPTKEAVGETDRVVAPGQKADNTDITIHNILEAGFRRCHRDASLGACFEVKNFLDEIITHKQLGHPILHALPHPLSEDVFNPQLSQFILSYSEAPEVTMCICYGNGPLKELLTKQDFRKHINDHVREVTKGVMAPDDMVDIYQWTFTEYVLGPNGKASIVDGKDIEKLSPLVKETVKARQDMMKLRDDRSREPMMGPPRNPNRPSTTFRRVVDTVLAPQPKPLSSSSKAANSLITDEIRSLLHGKYEEYGDPVFRRISNLNNPGSSYIKLNFTKVPSDQFQVGCDLTFTGDGGEGPDAVDEEQMLAEITRQVKQVLLGKEEEDGVGEKVKLNMPVNVYSKRGGQVRAVLNADSGEEVDQQIEAMAVRREYWNCYGSGDVVAG